MIWKIENFCQHVYFAIIYTDKWLPKISLPFSLFKKSVGYIYFHLSNSIILMYSNGRFFKNLIYPFHHTFIMTKSIVQRQIFTTEILNHIKRSVSHIRIHPYIHTKIVVLTFIIWHKHATFMVLGWKTCATVEPIRVSMLVHHLVCVFPENRFITFRVKEFHVTQCWFQTIFIEPKKTQLIIGRVHRTHTNLVFNTINQRCFFTFRID